MRSRTTWVALLLVAVAAAVALWFRPRAPQPPVRMGYLAIVSSLPVFIAQEQQLFAREGLAPQSTQFSSSNDMVNALIAGQLDLLPAVSIVPIIHLEIQHPGRVRVFSHSRMNKTNALDRIVVKDSSPIRTVADLRGRKVGLFAGTAPSKLLAAFLKKHGVDPRSVTYVQLAAAAQLSSLESGAVDALFSYEPVTTTALAKGYRELYGSVYADLLDPCPVGVSVIAREFERRQPHDAEASVRAVQQAITFMSSRPAEARALLPRFTAIPPEIARQVNISDVTLSNQVDAANLQAFIDLLYDIGEIPEKIDAHRLIAPTR